MWEGERTVCLGVFEDSKEESSDSLSAVDYYYEGQERFEALRSEAFKESFMLESEVF